MIGRFAGRATLIVLLLVVQFGFTVHWGTLGPEPSAWDLPGNDELGDGADQYVGADIAVTGVVRSTDPLLIELPAEGVNLRLVGHGIRADTEDRIRVYGTLREEDTILVRNGFTVPQRNLWATYAVSLLAGLWVTARFLAYWYVDVSSGAFKRRGEESHISDRLSEWFR